MGETKAVLAGGCISIGCIAFASVGGQALGAFLFSLGLLCVCLYGLPLYTGKVGLLAAYNKEHYTSICRVSWNFPFRLGWQLGTRMFVFIALIYMFLLNAVGCTAMALVTNMANVSCIPELCRIANAKMLLSLDEVFWRAILCGMLMELGVASWRAEVANISAQAVITVLCVVIFILAGAEHSVADAFYLQFADKALSLSTAAFIGMAVLGNAIGAVLVHLCLPLDRCE